MKMYVSGAWVDAPEMVDVLSPYSRERIDAIPQATNAQVEQALAAASVGSNEWLFWPAVSAQYGAVLLWLATC